MSDGAAVRIDTTNGVCRLTLCRPEVPALASVGHSRSPLDLVDGVARHSQEGLDFVARSEEVGFREAVRERDRPFGDYGERDR